MIRASAAVSWAAALALCGCATLPEGRVERGLYGDLRKGVELSEDTGWIVDRLQLETNLETALRSVCQAAPDRRERLRRFLQARIDAEGGSARLRYLENGRSLDGLGELLSLERVQALLAAAEAASESDCPFFLEPEPDFAGIEGNAHRTTLLLESQGFGAVLIKGDERALSGGGGVRVMVARGLSSQVSVAAGGEVGGSGTLDPGGTGEQLDAAIHLAVPLALRLTRFSRLLDFQLAPVFRFNQDEDPVPPGIRASVGAGIATMRKAAFMPFVVLWLGYEGHGLFDGSQETHSFRVGTRVGVDWDFGQP